MSALGGPPHTPSVVAAIDVVPDALQEELALALAIADDLADTTLRFVLAPGRRLRLQLSGPEGDRSLSGQEALELAAGG